MPQIASNDPLEVLVSWWLDMGVDVDTAAVDAMRAVFQDEATPQKGADIRPIRRGKQPVDRVAEARMLAAECSSLDALKAAIESFEGSPLKAGAQTTVVFDGVQGAPLMVIGEGPGGEEDRRGLPFVGKAGQLLDRMLASIGYSRTENTFITNVNYWRPPNNRNPDAEELDVCRPFVDRMIEIAKPKLIITAGAVPTKSLLDTSDGIMKLRGSEHLYKTPNGRSVPLIPILHPAYLLRRPQDKSRAWRDLLLAEQRLNELG